MAIPDDVIRECLDEPAYFCCQFPKGQKITAHELIEPSLFDDMVEANLMQMNPNALTIRHVLGKILATDVKAMTAVVPEVIEQKK